MDTTPLICPICGAPLERREGRYCCSAGHSYDVAREGYVHLLPANRKHARDPGDDREMVNARFRFLEGGWYAPLRSALGQLAADHMPPAGDWLVDAGCGEGYYTQGIAERLAAEGRGAGVIGVDLSKHALKKAARRTKLAQFAVASVYHMPVADGSAQVLLDCFAPLALEEYRRVLRPEGVFLYVVPGPEHLIEMKQVLYDQPYANPEEEIPYGGFAYLDVVPVEGRAALEHGALMDLFGMTPYAWKTPRAGVERLEALDGLTVTLSFRIHVFRRTGGQAAEIRS